MRLGMFNTLPKLAFANLIALAVLIALAFGYSDVSRVTEAQGAQSEDAGFTLVAFDTSLSELQDIEAADLAAKMILSDANEGLILVGQYSDHAEEPQTFATGDIAKEAVNDAIDGIKSRASEDAIVADLSEMLESYASFIEQIGQSGRVFILSAGRFTFHESTGVGGLQSVATELAGQGVTIHTISLATTPAPDREVLSAISSAGGGGAYDLGFLDGVLEFINSELRVTLTPSLQTDATGTAGETIDIGVPPHSAYLVAGFAFEDPETVNVIRQPNGQEITDTVGSVNAFSISGMKFFTVRNPQPGFWALRSAGGSGSLTMYSDVVNDLSVVMDVPAPFPVGEPFVITANALSGDLPLIDSSAEIDALITGPDGVEQTYVLNDLGEDGDVFSEDSVFSGTVAAQEMIGVSEVKLSMRWPNLSATIEGTGAFVVEPFPNIEIALVSEGVVGKDAKEHLATVDLKFNNAAFLAAQQDIEVSVVNAADGSTVDIELEPTEVVDEKVYQLRVLGVLTEEGEYEFNAKLKSSHLEREFTADAVTVTQQFELSTPTPIALYTALAIAGIIGFVLLVVIIRAMLQKSPFGYLYRVTSNGERELVADFRDYRRSLWDSLINKPIMPIAALPGVPLHGGRFIFSVRGVSFLYRPDSDGVLNVMLRGEPLQAGKTMIADGEEFQITGETFVYDRSAIASGVRVSDRLTAARKKQHEELETFALDPMTWDAPSSARPTRQRRN